MLRQSSWINFLGKLFAALAALSLCCLYACGSRQRVQFLGRRFFTSTAWLPKRSHKTRKRWVEVANGSFGEMGPVPERKRQCFWTSQRVWGLVFLTFPIRLFWDCERGKTWMPCRTRTLRRNDGRCWPCRKLRDCSEQRCRRMLRKGNSGARHQLLHGALAERSAVERQHRATSEPTPVT